MWTLQERYVKCGRGCASCPHGPYLFRRERQGKRLVWKYIGAMMPLQYLEEMSEHLHKRPLFSAAYLTFDDALDVIGIKADKIVTRERVRKAAYNQSAGLQRCTERFREICSAVERVCEVMGWTAPRTIAGKLLLDANEEVIA